ncbi:DegQ family serine endoprotease [Desulfococcus sp.]|uniref:DegQ family serine endoprotease n=1 Tax=Desulfococcus sp. TaxID=2025834 RepID=UPI003D0C017F
MKVIWKSNQSSTTRILILSALFFSLAWTLSIGSALAVAAGTPEPFTGVAKKVIPTVVFIKVEQTIEAAGTPFQYNNPFDLFEDDMFRRFFGQRFPQMRPQEKYKQTGWGSGFIISKEGYILTNHHVVGEADKIQVTLKDGREFEAKVIGTDPKSDVALIQIKGAKDLPVLPMGDSETLEIGEWVMAVGNPFGLSHTLTVGVVSAKGRTSVGITDYEDFIQTDAAINPGNSGGPLINMRGEAVGINSAIFSKSGGYMGIGFAIPINMVKMIKEQLIAHGKVDRGYLGVGIQDLSRELVESFGLDEGTEGVLISQVYEDSPAQKHGLERGDVLIQMDGKPVKDVGHFRNMIAMTMPGTKIDLTVIRKGKQKTVKVKLGNLSEAKAEEPTQNDLMEKIGITVQNLNEDLANQFGYQEIEGVLISGVKPGSPAAFAGLRPGMVILEANREGVQTVSDLVNALKASSTSKKVLLLVKGQHGTRYVGFTIE